MGTTGDRASVDGASVWAAGLRELDRDQLGGAADLIDAAVAWATAAEPSVFSPASMQCDSGALLLAACARHAGLDARVAVGFFIHTDPAAPYFDDAFPDGVPPLPYDEVHHWCEVVLDDGRILRLDPNGQQRRRDHVQLPAQSGYVEDPDGRDASFPSNVDPETLTGRGVRGWQVAAAAARRAVRTVTSR